MYQRLVGRRCLSIINNNDNNNNNNDVNNLDRDAYERVPITPDAAIASKENATEEPCCDDNNRHWTEMDHMIAAAKLAPFWFLSNFAYNSSLLHTSITSSTVLVNTGSLFAFLIALLIRDEKFSYLKLFGVLFGVTGCMLTGYHDAIGGGEGEEKEDNNKRLRFLFGDNNIVNKNNDVDDDHDKTLLLGDVLSVLSAAGYGVYTCMIRYLCPRDETLMSMQLFLGYVGFWNMIFLSPIVIYQLGIARNVVISQSVFGIIIVKALFDNVLSDYLWARSVVLTSATVASVGLGLTIPLAFVSDVFVGVEDVLNFESILGAGFVLFGFILVNMGMGQMEEQHQQELPLSEERHISIQLQGHEEVNREMITRDGIIPIIPAA